MHPPLSRLLPLYLLTIAVILSKLPSAQCANDTRFDDCRNHQFTCGNISNIKYPFWGLTRKAFCGQPGFEINCRDNIPLITMVSENYRILDINPQVSSLVVAREDYWDEICPASFFNTTIDPTIFSYGSGLTNLTLFYGCQFDGVSNISSIFLQNCTINNKDTNFFYATRNITIVPRIGYCNDTITMPIFERNARALDENTTTVSLAIHEGFELKWNKDIDQCSKCTESGGECGYNQTQSRFTCFCHDQPYPNVCHARPDNLPTSFCVDDPQYVACAGQFKCTDHHQNLEYPFWGNDRPTYCGHPGFQLNCTGEYAHITIESTTYRVLGINTTIRTPTMRVAREDLVDDICPKYLNQTTLDYTLFKHLPNDQNLTLYYGCLALPVPTGRPPFSFDCSVNITNTSNYFLTTQAQATLNFNSLTCENIQVAVNGTGAQKLSVPTASSDDLKEVLAGGFELEWDANDADCNSCARSGGRCGYNVTTSSFSCLCIDRPYPFRCNETGDGKSSSSPKTLGIVLSVVGAIVAGICVGWLIFFCRQRRKKRIAATSATQTLSKELPPSHSSTSLRTSPATHFSQTMPSYRTSISDVEKGSTYFGVQVFSYTELVQATNNFDPSKELGDGGFGTVYYGTLQDGRVVAVKRLYENNFKRVEQFMNEVEILTRLDHENLVKLYGCTSKRSRELLLVYEYIPNGTVADHLHGKQANTGFLSWSVRLKIAVETAEALAYLHASDIIHRDVKTNNILLDNSFRVKVADFGLSRLFPNAATHVSTMPQGTPGYVDPEYYRCYKLTDKSDVYSFGVVLAELLSSLQAVDTDRHRQDINLASLAISKIQSRFFSELVDKRLGFDTNASVKKTTIMVGELAFRCLQEEKDLRPSMKEVLDILKGIQNEELDVQTVGVSDVVVDDGALLKGKDPLRSPDSVTDRWISGSTQNSTD